MEVGSRSGGSSSVEWQSKRLEDRKRTWTTGEDVSEEEEPEPRQLLLQPQPQPKPQPKPQPQPQPKPQRRRQQQEQQQQRHVHPNAVDFQMFRRYDIATPFFPQVDIKSHPQYSLYLHGGEGERLEFGVLKFESGIYFAKIYGISYIGNNTMRPASYAETGACIEQHTLGVDLCRMIALLATQEKDHLDARGANAPLPRSDWAAGFEWQPPSSSQRGSRALCFRVFMKNPYPNSPTAWFQDDFVMYPFS